ncbi:MAG: hypothetical protein H6617_00660 [Bdellovibrionaceae bacterium]|nr:hypothetical protein [Bdellovibrionales bacterium]MCB9253177.1 hypothetical protein [Pseudobdellovibrionaceae bacterium]
MKKRSVNPVQSIQRCGCGTIRVDLGNFSIKYEKEAFLQFAKTVYHAAQMLEDKAPAKATVVPISRHSQPTA